MVLASFRMMIPAAKHAEAVTILTRIAERARAEPGCISSYLYLDAQDKNAIRLEQVWRTDDDLMDHLRSEEFRNVLLVAEIAMEAPEIVFGTIIPRNAMETIEEARGCKECLRM